jgi:hypothetical protein
LEKLKGKFRSLVEISFKYNKIEIPIKLGGLDVEKSTLGSSVMGCETTNSKQWGIPYHASEFT